MTKGLLNYVQVNYSLSVTDQLGVPWVVVAVDPGDPTGMVQVIEAKGCWSSVKASDREYLETLLSDWKKTCNRDGAALLASLGELSVGPIKAASTGQCAKEDLVSIFKQAD